MIERTFEGGRFHSSLVAIKFYDDEDIITKYGATIYGYGWWYDEEDIITKYGAMGRAMRWRKEDIIYSHRSEFAISSLLWINSLSSFIRNQQLNSYFSFQELSRYMTYFTEETPSNLIFKVLCFPLALAISYHINTQREVFLRESKMFDRPTVWVNHQPSLVCVFVE